MTLSKNYYTTNSSRLAREIKGCWAIAATGPARRMKARPTNATVIGCRDFTRSHNKCVRVHLCHSTEDRAGSSFDRPPTIPTREILFDDSSAILAAPTECAIAFFRFALKKLGK